MQLEQMCLINIKLLLQEPRIVEFPVVVSLNVCYFISFCAQYEKELNLLNTFYIIFGMVKLKAVTLF